MASGLDTTPEMEFGSPSGFTSIYRSSYHSVIGKAAELLDLQLPAKEVKSNLITEVLVPPSGGVEYLLPFHEAVSEPVMLTWEKPASAPAVSTDQLHLFYPPIQPQKAWWCRPLAPQSKACLFRPPQRTETPKNRNKWLKRSSQGAWRLTASMPSASWGDMYTNCFLLCRN